MGRRDLSPLVSTTISCMKTEPNKLFLYNFKTCECNTGKNKLQLKVESVELTISDALKSV
jgi:hypothetical protein